MNQKSDVCGYCEETIYVKETKYSSTFSAPVSKIGKMQIELYEITGDKYIELENTFCPICGKRKEKKDGNLQIRKERLLERRKMPL